MNAISSSGHLVSSASLLTSSSAMSAAVAPETPALSPESSTTVMLGQSTPVTPLYSAGGTLGPTSQTPQQGSLSVKTASGALVDISSAANGSDIEITLKQGSLSAAERAELEKLSEGFRKVMAGLSGEPPRLDLSAVTRFNASLLTSVDLQAKVSGTNALTLDFHADSTTRSVKTTGTVGTLDIRVDFSKRAILGSESQQQRALNQYLKQFDRAQSRGAGDNNLMAMFKQAFTDLNSHVGDSALAEKNAQPTLYLSRSDKNMLTGLADFTASIAQNPQQINPVRLNEVESFSYQVAQTTTLSGSDELNREFTQKQQSHLRASYHQPLAAGQQLNLTANKNSQNYLYLQVDDKAESTTAVRYRQGEMVSATLDQSVESSTRQQKYIKGWLESDASTPQQTSRTTDLLASLKTDWEGKNARVSFADYLRQHSLPDFGEEVLLTSDPQAL